MSMSIVRTNFEASLKAYLATLTPAIVFHDTINKEVKPSPSSLWCTVEYYSDYIEPVCYGGKAWRSFGTIDVLVFSRPGTGYTIALKKLDDIVEEFMSKDIGGNTVIIGAVAPQERAGGDASSFFSAVATLEFEHYHT